MKKHYYSLSSAPTSTQSKSTSCVLSGFSTPAIKSPSVDNLKRSLTKKQLFLTESLINYSKTLSEKIPELAKRWTLEDKRLNRVLAEKHEIALRFNQKITNSQKLEILQQQVLAAEANLAQNQDILNSLKHKVSIMQSRKRDYEKTQSCLIAIELKLRKLQEKHTKLKKYKEISLKNLIDLESSQMALKEIEEIYLTKSEKLIVGQDNIVSSIASVMEALENLRQDSKILENEKIVKKLRKVAKDLQNEYNEIQEKNIKKRSEIKGSIEKVEAKLALIRLEGNHVAQKRKKIAQLSEFFKTKLLEVKKLQTSQR